MVFGVAAVISHVSAFMTLGPGDVLLTGSPAGNGARSRPPRFLRRGDHVRASIAGWASNPQSGVNGGGRMPQPARERVLWLRSTTAISKRGSWNRRRIFAVAPRSCTMYDA